MQTYFNITSKSSTSDSNKFNFNYNLLYSVYSFPNFVRLAVNFVGVRPGAQPLACAFTSLRCVSWYSAGPALLWRLLL